ncbi:hypothetical protein LSAT2_000542 [Lamellibrachia satsuma]|nr:hypothetical protein LSAT2_000542 [Lamellibrachia satsuma]
MSPSSISRLKKIADSSQNVTKKKERNKTLKDRLETLEKHIGYLQTEGTSHLKARLAGLGIVAETPAEFLSQAKEIVLRHKDLQLQVTTLQDVITQLESEGHKLASLTQWYAASEEEHQANLKEVLHRLVEAGLRLKKDKYNFGVAAVEYLGHQTSKDGLATLDKRIRAVVEAPTDVTQVVIPGHVDLLPSISTQLGYDPSTTARTAEERSCLQMGY